MQKSQLKIIKENLKRAYGFNRALKKYFYSLLLTFAINIGLILYFITAQKNISPQIFIAAWIISAIVIVRIFYNIYTENIAENLPSDFNYESKIRPAPIREIKIHITFIGNLHMRGFSGRLYIYPDEIIVRFRKHCLVIKDITQVEIQKFLLFYIVEFNVGKKYVQCSLNKKDKELLENLIKNKSLEKA